MSYYTDVYQKRLNRYGNDYQTRIQKQRERDFEGKLLKSVYRVDFLLNEELQSATLEPYKQDETQLMQYLLTRVDLEMPNGTILMIPDKNNIDQPWMVYWLESLKASGYNRYIVLKMTHFITWKDEENNSYNSWAYMHGKQDGVLKDVIQGGRTIYMEDDTSNFLLMPLNKDLKKDTYLEIGEGELKQAFIVTGYDIQSTKGVEYVTVDPVYIRDHSSKPTQTETDNPDDFYWLNGGE